MNYNLLPWREAAALRRRCYLMWAVRVGVVLGFLAVLIAAMVFHQRAAVLSARQQQLSAAIEAAKAQRRKTPTSVAVVSVHTPAGFRKLLHQLFFGMADQVCMTSLHVNNTSVAFHGQAPNEVALSHFLPAWPVGAFFSSLHLQSMNEDADQGVTVFEVSGVLAQAVSDNDDDVDA